MKACHRPLTRYCGPGIFRRRSRGSMEHDDHRAEPEFIEAVETSEQVQALKEQNDASRRQATRESASNDRVRDLTAFPEDRQA